jgi:hypothetical protein
VVARPDGVCPEERPAALERSGVVAVVDPASRHATALVAGVQQAVSTHPVSASGIRRSSRPCPVTWGVVVQRSGGRPAAVHPVPVSIRAVSIRAVSIRAVSIRLVSAFVGPDASVSSHSGGGGGDQVKVAGRPLATGTGGGPVAAGPLTARRRSRRPRRGRCCRPRVGQGGSVADPGRRVGCGPRRPRLTTERPGRPGRRSERPLWAVALWARGQAAARGGCIGRVAASAAWLPSSGWGATTVCGRRRG